MLCFFAFCFCIHVAKSLGNTGDLGFIFPTTGSNRLATWLNEAAKLQKKPRITKLA
jgi:hypothetical protein